MNTSLKTLSILHILNDGYRTTAVTILPFVARDLSLNLTQVGILGSSQTFIGTLFALPAGYLAAKLGGFNLLLSSLILYAIGFLGIAASPNFVLLLCAFYLGATGFAFFHPVSFALVARLSDPHTRGKNMGNFMSLGDIGRMIIPSIVLFMIPFIGWRPAMMGCASIGLGIYIFSRLQIKKEVALHQKENSLPFGKRAWFTTTLSLLKEKPFRNALLSGMGDTLASSSIYIFLPFLLLSRGVDTRQLVIFTSCYFLGSLAGKSLLGRAVDVYGNRKTFVFSEFGMTIVLLVLIMTKQFYLYIFLSFLLGLFTKGTSPVVQTLISQTIHQSHYEKAFGASETFIQLAGAVSIFISGLVADRFGISSVFYLAAILAIVATFPIMISRWRLNQ